MLSAYDDTLAVLAYTAVSCITPGPNNLMLATLGVSRGWRVTLPAMASIVVGDAALVIVAGAGLSVALMAWPQAHLFVTALHRGMGLGGLGFEAMVAESQSPAAIQPHHVDLAAADRAMAWQRPVLKWLGD